MKGGEKMTNAVVLSIAKDLRKLADGLEKLVGERLDRPDETTASKQKVTLETVRARLATLMQAGKQTEVKALLQKHGGERLSDIPEENYPALLKDAEGV